MNITHPWNSWTPNHWIQNHWKAPVLALVSLFLLSACVTINIYFPAAAAEKAADRIIRDVLGEDATQIQTPPDESSYRPNRITIGNAGLESVETPVLLMVLNQLVPAAQAADLNVSTPAINQLRASMKARISKLKPHLKKGALGYANDGLIQVRDMKAVSLKERGSVKKLVAAENADRNALYREIAKANGHPEWENQIRSTFAQRWVSNAPAGWWYQNASGGWAQK